jgi:hypothetical protein
LTQRNAQLVFAREYGYAGWQDLTAEVSKRLGHGLELAVRQALGALRQEGPEDGRVAGGGGRAAGTETMSMPGALT